MKSYQFFKKSNTNQIKRYSLSNLVHSMKIVHPFPERTMKVFGVKIYLSFLVIVLSGCLPDVEPSNPNKGQPLDLSTYSGTGNYLTSITLSSLNKSVHCFYNIPENADSKSPVLILIHGNARDAEPLRNSLIAKSNAKGIILLAPEFSNGEFSFNEFALGNLFEDGENASGLNPSDEWLFNHLESLWMDFKGKIGSENDQFDLFGMSAGGQFVHRFAYFGETTKCRNLFASSSGWYTCPNTTTSYPYGLEGTPNPTMNLSKALGRQMIVMVGSLDTDPNSSGLRHTAESDIQGLNRVERAQFFIGSSIQASSTLQCVNNWSFLIVPNAGHSGELMGNAAMDEIH
ncbi:MAG: hypothetical protein P8N56_03765 [Schleiferiaceae bacterium]|nr:hypothetical protein [Schleiferiaceae bacterium]